MLVLYELRWSHYCEKVRLALRYLGVPYAAVGIDAFTKRELANDSKPGHLPCVTVPALRDESHFIMDSTPILQYLATHHDSGQRLFPGDPANQAAIVAKLLEFDTMLAIPARRFGYSQVILECPSLLPSLFMPTHAGGFFNLPGVRWITGHVVGVVLCKRFDFHQSESLGLYEGLEAWLLALSQELSERPFVVGDNFSAADLALAAQLRPLSIVPYFRDDPRLKGLFERQESVLAAYSDEGDFPYQQAIKLKRLKLHPYRRRIRSSPGNLPFAVKNHAAGNDQSEVWDRKMWHMFYRYWGIWTNKKRIQGATAEWR